MYTLIKAKPVYFRNLDGLRFIAAFFVIIGHCQSILGTYLKVNPYMYFADKLASFGVDFFFVLSGFLISFLLFEELERTGTINIKKFYIRRILRLWPLYFIFSFTAIFTASYFIQALGLLDRPQSPEELRSNLLYLSFFSVNFQILIGMNFPGSYTVGHFWSLSVEEQFYLMWAPLMWLFRKRVGLLLALMTLTGLIMTVWQPTIYEKWYKTNAHMTIYYATYSRFMYFGLGATLAYAIHKKSVIAAFLNMSDKKSRWLQIGFSLLVLAFSHDYLFRPVYYTDVQERLINACLSTSVVLMAILPHTILNLELLYIISKKAFIISSKKVSDTIFTFIDKK